MSSEQRRYYGVALQVGLFWLLSSSLLLNSCSPAGKKIYPSVGSSPPLSSAYFESDNTPYIPDKSFKEVVVIESDPNSTYDYDSKAVIPPVSSAAKVDALDAAKKALLMKEEHDRQEYLRIRTNFGNDLENSNKYVEYYRGHTTSIIDLLIAIISAIGLLVVSICIGFEAFYAGPRFSDHQLSWVV